MRVYVVDASVVAKWYVPEELSSEAAALLDAADEGTVRLIAPDLIVAEFGNILWKRWCRDELTREEIHEILDAFLQVSLELTPATELLKVAATIALDTRRAVYDALYLALAQSRDTVVITADERLVNSLRETTLGKYICWLGQWQAPQRENTEGALGDNPHCEGRC